MVKNNNLIMQKTPPFTYFDYVLKPTNLYKVITLYDRICAAWLVFSCNAVAVKWYSYSEAKKMIK